jgi:phosphatidylglycerol:prolipoprotein diacylglycerol transferase
MMPSLALGIAFGRLGCFFNGCCFGLPGHTGLCVVFPEESLAGSVFPHTHIHPTQLYETTAMLILFAGLLLFDRKPRAIGLLTGLFLLVYGAWRYYVEGIRWYESSMILAQSDAMRFTLSQLISVIMVIVGIVFILKARKPPPQELSS